jgi:hypothetical protein
MLTYFTTIFVLSFIIESAANLITESYIFEGYRNFIANLNKDRNPESFLYSIFDKLKYSSTCHLCTSHQLSFLVCLIPTLPFVGLNPFFQLLINSLFIGRLSYILHALYDKFVFSEGIIFNILHTHITHDGDKND